MFTRQKLERGKNMRKKVIAGNWKMNKTPEETRKFMEEFIPLVKDTECEVIICAPFIDLKCLVKHFKETNVKIGAQNMHWEESGAYTGEISGSMLKEIGVEYVIIGPISQKEDNILRKRMKQ